MSPVHVGWQQGVKFTNEPAEGILGHSTNPLALRIESLPVDRNTIIMAAVNRPLDGVEWYNTIRGAYNKFKEFECINQQCTIGTNPISKVESQVITESPGQPPKFQVKLQEAHKACIQATKSSSSNDFGARVILAKLVKEAPRNQVMTFRVPRWGVKGSEFQYKVSLAVVAVEPTAAVEPTVNAAVGPAVEPAAPAIAVEPVILSVTAVTPPADLGQVNTTTRARVAEFISRCPLKGLKHWLDDEGRDSTGTKQDCVSRLMDLIQN